MSDQSVTVQIYMSVSDQWPELVASVTLPDQDTANRDLADALRSIANVCDPDVRTMWRR